MIPAETLAHIRHLFYGEHWKIGTIAVELGLHRDTVRNALETDRFNRGKILRASNTDPYISFIKETLSKYPRLRATRIHEMLRVRGYTGSVVTVRRVVSELRPTRREAFLRLRTFPGEQAQVDWAHFGVVNIGRAQRRLSCFVITLSYSRALYLEFFFDQTLENLLRGHVRAFNDWGGLARILLYDNLRSAVLERRGDADAAHIHVQHVGVDTTLDQAVGQGDAFDGQALHQRLGDHAPAHVATLAGLGEIAWLVNVDVELHTGAPCHLQ